MQRKQNVTSRRYFVRKSSTTPDADSSALHGGFKYLSRFSGSSRPLKRAALRSICFTSLTRPLHRSHRGDSGTTNLVVNENKAIPSLCCHNRVYYRSRYFNSRDTKTSVVTNFFRSFRHREWNTWNSFITRNWPSASYERWLPEEFHTRHFPSLKTVSWSRDSCEVMKMLIFTRNPSSSSSLETLLEMLQKNVQ